MAGHVPKRVLKLPEVDKILLEGTSLYKWEEGDLHKVVFKADKDGFFLVARGDDKTKVYESYIWDFALISDVRGGKAPKDIKLQEKITALTSSDSVEDFCLTLVYRRDGIVNLDYMNLVCESPETAERFKMAVNALTWNMLHAHAAPCVFLRKGYIRIQHFANGYGQIMPKYIHRVMMLKSKQDFDFINQFLANFNIMKVTDGGVQYVSVEDFTEEIFLRMVDQILNNRINDLDIVVASVAQKATKIHKIQLTLQDFLKFLNSEQRDPRLNEILHPYTTAGQARILIRRHEVGRVDDRLTAKGLMEYLMSEESNILNLDHLDQHMDMTKPMSYYFINSSHNTYLTGHQLRSTSTSEMYIQALLLGCRCLELDCWPINDGEDICITHGGTWCTKVSFKEVVEAINEFAFVKSDYPLVLSIENHCKKYSGLIKRMATLFTIIFGDKLVKEPFDDIPLEPGVPLPSPERFKRRILLKDKVKRQKGGELQFMGTLPKGVHVPTLDELPEEGEGVQVNSSETFENNAEGTVVLPAVTKPPPEQEKPAEDGEKVPDGGESLPTKEQKEETDESDCERKVPAENSDCVANGENNSDVVKEHAKVARSQSEDSSCSSVTGISVGSTPMLKKNSNGELTGIEDFQELMSAHSVARPSEVEALVGGPLLNLLNYCTGISFEGFAVAEKVNCSYFMSSFAEEKGVAHIKQQPKDYVKYNMRQMSRIYPQGTRFNSSNYMPQIYWNVGCQLVALNYQTPDLPMQLNGAKFEFNGGTGLILKPWVLLREKTGVGPFNPFVQSKIEDIVPAKLSLKVISGIFLTEKKTNCAVEAEMYGLPADTERRKFYTKKALAPHPFWNDDAFTFKRILLPELAMLRVAVFDDDRELIGQRFLPVDAIRPGFRHISLRDKHNQALPLATLFVHIKVEDWVPGELEDVVAMLMDPLQYANEALKQLAMGDDFDENGTDDGGAESLTPVDSKPSTAPGTPLATPTHSAGQFGNRKASGQSGSLGLPPQLPSSSNQNPGKQPSKTTTLPIGGFEDTLPALDEAKRRAKELKAIPYDSKVILEHPEYLKVTRRQAKQKLTLMKKLDKSLKPLQSKQSKAKAPAEAAKLQKACREVEAQNRAELLAYDQNTMAERHEKHIQVVVLVHKAQLKDIEKAQAADVKKMNAELLTIMRKHRKNSDYTDQKAGMRDIEEKAIQLGKRMRGEFERLHFSELKAIELNQEKVMEDLAKLHEKERQDLEKEASLGPDMSAL